MFNCIRCVLVGFDDMDHIVKIIKTNSQLVSNDFMVIFGNEIKVVEINITRKDVNRLREYHELYQYCVKRNPRQNRRYKPNEIYINIKCEDMEKTISIKKQWLYVNSDTYEKGECNTCLEPDLDLVQLLHCKHYTQCKKCHEQWVIQKGNGCTICRTDTKRLSVDIPVIVI